MPLSRRRFLRTSTFTVLAAGCALGPARALAQDASNYYDVPFEATQSSVFYYEPSTFEPYVGGLFRANVGRTATNLKLLSVKSYAPQRDTRLTTGRTRQTESFTLTFQGGGLSTLSDLITLNHAALGSFGLLMTRHPDGNEGFFYEAVINQFS